MITLQASITKRPCIKIKRRVKLFASRNIDPYRESSLRYMGYANEVGEACAPFIPDWGLPASYCVAISYIVFDTIDKAEKAYESAPKERKLEETLKKTLETLIWQLLASVFWSGSCIRFITSIAEIGTDNEYLSTLVGLLAIPQIIKPIDNTVDTIMEGSVSKIIGGEFDKKYLMNTLASASLPPTLYKFADMLHNLDKKYLMDILTSMSIPPVVFKVMDVIKKIDIS
jgi:fission process protein 1